MGLGQPPGAPAPAHDQDALAAFASALSAAFRAGIAPASITAVMAAACAAYAAAREEIDERVAAAILHNDDDGPDGPMVLLPLPDDVLSHFINKLHSDR